VIYVTYSAIFMQIFLLASIWITVMLAVERFIAICRPFLANKMCTVNKARIIILVIYTLAVICRLPNFWENRIVTVYDTTMNSTLAYMEVTDFSVNEHYMVLYPWIIDVIITSMIPFLLLILLNVKLIWEVKKSTQYLRRNRIIRSNRKSSIAKQEDLQITIMLISVIMVFFVCQAPYVIYTAIVSINKFAAHSSGLMLFRYVTMLLLTLKSAVNFILYCWFSEKFWATFKKMFCFNSCVVSLCRNNETFSGSYYSLRRMSTAQSSTRDTVI
jgi:thyrotropin-releasing hormone receptor